MPCFSSSFLLWFRALSVNSYSPLKAERPMSRFSECRWSLAEDVKLCASRSSQQRRSSPLAPSNTVPEQYLEIQERLFASCGVLTVEWLGVIFDVTGTQCPPRIRRPTCLLAVLLKVMLPSYPCIRAAVLFHCKVDLGFGEERQIPIGTPRTARKQETMLQRNDSSNPP